MSTIIKDGAGTGTSAQVDLKKRLRTKATTTSGAVTAKQAGKAYFISTGLVNLTSANQSAILYLKTLEESDVVIESIQLQFGLSTGGTGDVIREDFVVATGGTLLSNAVPGLSTNLNAGSSETFDATVYKGVEGDTVTAFSTGQSIYQQATDYIEPGGFIVPKGSDLAMSITPPAGNTSMNVVVNVTLHLLDAE